MVWIIRNESVVALAVFFAVATRPKGRYVFGVDPFVVVTIADLVIPCRFFPFFHKTLSGHRPRIEERWRHQTAVRPCRTYRYAEQECRYVRTYVGNELYVRTVRSVARL